MKIIVHKPKRGFAPVAMADIAFLLLIFLIVTVSIGDNPDLVLPIFEKSEDVRSAESETISLDKNGELSIRGRAYKPEDAGRVLASLLGRTDFVIIVQADASLPYSTVDDLLATLGAAGFRKIALATREPGE